MVYAFSRNDDVTQYTSTKLIVKWFVENPGKKYKSQQEIAEAISRRFPAGRTQSAISKAFKTLLDCEFTYMSRTYAITKYGGYYVLVDGEQVALTPTEYSILRLLMANPGKVFSTKALYESVWQEAALGSEGAVAVHIRHLREKIEINPSEPRYLKVVWGQGYKMEGGK